MLLSELVVNGVNGTVDYRGLARAMIHDEFEPQRVVHQGEDLSNPTHRRVSRARGSDWTKQPRAGNQSKAEPSGLFLY